MPWIDPVTFCRPTLQVLSFSPDTSIHLPPVRYWGRPTLEQKEARSLPTGLSPPFFVLQPSQLCHRFLLKGLFPEPEEGTLVSGSQFLFPQVLFGHCQAKATKGAGATVELADFTPLKVESWQSEGKLPVTGCLGTGMQNIKRQHPYCMHLSLHPIPREAIK